MTKKTIITLAATAIAAFALVGTAEAHSGKHGHGGYKSHGYHTTYKHKKQRHFSHGPRWSGHYAYGPRNCRTVYKTQRVWTRHGWIKAKVPVKVNCRSPYWR